MGLGLGSPGFPAPAWTITEWLNVPGPLTLEALRGHVIFLHAFQMLCRGCVTHGIPQAKRVAEAFEGAPLLVVGLHTVFENHEAMTPQALRAFVHEHRVMFPVGIDAPSVDGRSMPQTMRAYDMQGTPTAALIDASGQLRLQVLGACDDLSLGAALQTLVLEARNG